MDPADQKKTACYDIDVEVDDPLKSQMNNFLSSTTNQQEIAALEMKAMHSQPHSIYCSTFLSFMLTVLFCCGWQIHETIEYINQLKTERDFMLSFSNNPQDFIQDWLKSQSRDLKVNVILFSSSFYWDCTTALPKMVLWELGTSVTYWLAGALGDFANFWKG